MKDAIFSGWSASDFKVLEQLKTPYEIQLFLDGVAYPATERNRCPLNVIHDRQAHCLDGALFAAAALRRIGYPPLLLDMLPAQGMDDDHVLAIFKKNGSYGAVAKSNFVGLRFREPVYRTPRELVMSYFDFFFNVNGEKSLRAYSRAFNLTRFDKYSWMTEDSGADEIEKYLKTLKQIPLVSKEVEKEINHVDDLTYKSGMLVVNMEGLFKPRV